MATVTDFLSIKFITRTPEKLEEKKMKKIICDLLIVGSILNTPDEVFLDVLKAYVDFTKNV